jgi:hypothetical protein
MQDIRDRLGSKEQSVKGAEIKGSSPVKQFSQESHLGSDSSGVSQDQRLKRTAVIRGERWTSGVASSRRKIYQLEVL